MSVDLIAIGTSLGGLQALKTLLKTLPDDLVVPVAVVIHRHIESDDFIVDLLQQHSQLPVSEANDKSPIKSGTVTLAPAGYHLLVDDGVFSLLTDEPSVIARPSIDVLFESCADAYGSHLIGVILTGNGTDGANGLKAIQMQGGGLLVEDPLTAECGSMPKAAIAATGTSNVYPLADIGPQLMKMCPVALNSH